ncbi:hypothetical protein SHIRM173S_11235 [Streptomyces hirsutus]
MPGAQDWAAEVAAGMDAGVRVSLRLDLSAYDLFDGAAEGAGGTGARGAGAAVVQVHSLADPTLVADAAALGRGRRTTRSAPARAWTPPSPSAGPPVSGPRWTGSPTRTYPTSWHCPRTS